MCSGYQVPQFYKITGEVRGLEVASAHAERRRAVQILQNIVTVMPTAKIGGGKTLVSKNQWHGYGLRWMHLGPIT